MFTKLHSAAENGLVDEFRALVKAGQSIDDIDKGGERIKYHPRRPPPPAASLLPTPHTSLPARPHAIDGGSRGEPARDHHALPRAQRRPHVRLVW